MFMPAGGPQWIVIVGVDLHINSGLRRDKGVRHCHILERFDGWVGGIQGLVLGGIHHETIVRPSTDQCAGHAAGWRRPDLNHVPAKCERTNERDSTRYSYHASYFHCFSSNLLGSLKCCGPACILPGLPANTPPPYA